LESKSWVPATSQSLGNDYTIMVALESQKAILVVVLFEIYEFDLTF